MKKVMSFPKVLLVGRTNVGKSTLFNRLAETKKSIVFEREGVTRDYIQETLTWNDKTFDLIDTGGMVLKKHSDEIQKRVQEKIFPLLEKAAVIFFVVDGKNGLVQEDLDIARILRRTKKKVVLLVNKADNQTKLEENMHEFYKLGFGEIIETSGIHGIGISTMLQKIVDTVPDPKADLEEKPRYKVTIIGKPNVGKSSLMNLLIREDRSIVSDVAGTTREPISQNIYYSSEILQIVDTAGVRRKRSVNDDLETLMVKSSMESIRTADIVVVMIDASQGHITDQELKLLFYAYEQKKVLIVLFNKTDLLDEYSRMLLEQSIEEYQFILKKLPVIWTSCITKKNVNKVLKEIETVWDRCKQEINSTELNEIIQETLHRKPLYKNQILMRVFKIRVIKGSVPTFVLHVNHPPFFEESELGFIENTIRKHYDLRGCPIQMHVKKV